MDDFTAYLPLDLTLDLFHLPMDWTWRTYVGQASLADHNRTHIAPSPFQDQIRSDQINNTDLSHARL